jgi:hypothetical protein
MCLYLFTLHTKTLSSTSRFLKWSLSFRFSYQDLSLPCIIRAVTMSSRLIWLIWYVCGFHALMAVSWLRVKTHIQRSGAGRRGATGGAAPQHPAPLYVCFFPHASLSPPSYHGSFCVILTLLPVVDKVTVVKVILQTFRFCPAGTTRPLLHTRNSCTYHRRNIILAGDSIVK